MSAHCRSCGAEIFWAVTESGKAMPIDAKPTSTGNLVLRDHTDNVGTVQVLDSPMTVLDAKKAGARDDEPRFTSHFATCPNSASHRKPKVKK